ncbi:MAG: PIN domain-containing protein [Candidatus Nanosalina sp.]
MKKILLDTNFLTAPFQLDFDIFAELDRLYGRYELYTLDDGVQEARSIEGGKYGDLVEKLLDNKDIEVLETTGEGEVDDLIVRLSEGFTVATNDKELKNRLVEEGREVVIVRSGNHLEKVNEQHLK